MLYLCSIGDDYYNEETEHPGSGAHSCQNRNGDTGIIPLNSRKNSQSLYLLTGFMKIMNDFRKSA